MRRLAAVAAALALVVGAVFARQRIDGGSDGAVDGATIRLLCGTDLAAACGRLAARDRSITLVVEDEGVSTDRLSALAGANTGAGFDAWLVAAPWPSVVADNRAQRGSGGAVLGRSSRVLARSPAVIVARDTRATALQSACTGAVTWSCIGRFAGSAWTEAGGQATWGTVKPGLAAPDRGSGLVVLSQAVASQVRTSNWASNDLDDPTNSAWFDQLVGQARRSGVGGQTPLSRLLVVPASFAAVGALESEAGPAVARAADRSSLRVIYPEPVTTADVTLTPPVGGDAGRMLQRIGPSRVSDALAATGWRVPGRSPVDGVGAGPALPRSSGLPSAGALQNLSDRWELVP